MNRKNDGCVTERSGYNVRVMMGEGSMYDRRGENGVF
jgi:hypothetical protein